MANPTNEPVTLVTKELIYAVAGGIGALRDQAALVAADQAAKADTSTGRMLRQSVEERLQKADLLAGWVKRHMRSVGLNEEDGLYV